MEPPKVLWDRAVRPRTGFAARAREAPGLREALGGMLLWRTPIAFLSLLFGYAGFQATYARLASPESGLWTSILARLPEAVDPQDFRAALARLPELPSMYQMLPWLALLAPLVVLSLWLHDATMDHVGLWLLGGLKTRRGLRASFVADAEALKVEALGALAGLLGELPGTGFTLTLLLLPIAVYFWVLRGYALAAWHGCPPWKGVVATLLNILLAVLMVGVMLLACLVMVMVVVQ